MQLTSPAFEAGGTIPTPYTCTGDGTSPPLRWRDVPEGTRSLALVVDDPDAPRGTFTHWLLADLPPVPGDLPAQLDVRALAQRGGLTPVEGTNDFGTVGYGAPCPPRGDRPHRYQFRLYALDDALGLETGFTRDELAEALGGHVLAEVELVGMYERAR